MSSLTHLITSTVATLVNLLSLAPVPQHLQSLPLALLHHGPAGLHGLDGELGPALPDSLQEGLQVGLGVGGGPAEVDRLQLGHVEVRLVDGVDGCG